MSGSILIGYATRSGSTAEVAESIGATMREVGYWPNLFPLRQVGSLKGYSSLIIGVPLYIGHFPKEFHQFAIRHRLPLSSMKPWIFVLGPTRDDPKDFEDARKQAEKELRRHPWIQPAEIHVFGGRWSTSSLPFPFSIITRLPAMKKIPASDIRDWPAIRAWALDVAHQAKLAA